jgi:CPA2 family monovalent cation:H+ antiporter-2
VEQQASLIPDITVALAVALAGGWLATRVGLPSLAGYVLAGVVISPFTPGYVGDVDSLLAVADIGIVLLLFGIGVQFSLRDLLETGPFIAAVATVQVAAVVGAASLAGMAVGWSTEQSLYFGAAAAISSGAALVKILEWRGDVTSRFGRIAVAWSVSQDICAVVLIVLLSAIAEGSSASTGLAGAAGLAVMKAGAFIAAVLAIGIVIVPRVLSRVAETGSRELFVLAIAVLAIATALASDYAGLSLALGAFLAGIVVSESDLSHRVLGDLLPARDVFAVLFFTSVGMLLDPAIIGEEWAAVLALSALVVVLKPAVSWALLRLRELPDTSLLTAASLASAGEFSFVLGRSGFDRGHLSLDAFTALLAATALSVLLVQALTRSAHAWIGRTPVATAAIILDPVPRPARLGRRAVVCGYGRTGRIVARTLAPRFEVLVVEEDRRRAAQARAEGFEVVETSPAHPATIERMALQDARQLIITLSDPFATRLITERARLANPHLDISGVAVAETEAARLRHSGITTAVMAEDEVAFELARHGLHRFGVSSREALAIVQHLRERGFP